MADKFMSPEWCEKAQVALNASEEMVKGFRDAETFTNKMMFDCNDSDAKVHLEWDKGKITYMGPAKFADDDLWLIIRADLAAWKEAASGNTEGGKLLMAGKIKFAKGPITAAVQNAGAFNAFLKTWGVVDTDWEV
ncbi:MAG: SCP2 sterol-binding domain-containing protein [Acidimicrobiia bacterium]